MKKRLNSQALLEGVCFSVFAAFALYLAISGKYLLYVTPRMVPYLYFTAAVMLVWAASSFRRLFRPEYNQRAAHCLVLIIPVMFLLLPHSQLSSSTLSSGYLDGNSIVLSGGTASSGTSGTAGASAQSGAAGAATGEEGGKSALTANADGSITVSDGDFYRWLSEIFGNPEKYEGASITLKGYVFRDSSQMSEDEFVPARLLMYCCAADLTPCGMLCRYDGTSEFEDGEWVTVTGAIHAEDVDGETQPVITASSVVPAEKPEDEYVYPW